MTDLSIAAVLVTPPMALAVGLGGADGARRADGSPSRLCC